jgi:UDP-GlcNAc3NAcA epimerase
MKIITIVGARPQFVKAAVVSRAIEKHNMEFPTEQIDEIIVHTGQHYDDNMSAVFFNEMQIPAPKYHLGIGGGTHGVMTGQMLGAIEALLLEDKPDMVLVYGDTNSTLAGALAAAKLHIPVAHVEGGLRNYDRSIPEELNRILTDHLSTWIFCPSQLSVDNLAKEGLLEEKRDKAKTYVHNVGDVMYDAVCFYRDRAVPVENIRNLVEHTGDGFCLTTIHRAGNTDNIVTLKSIFDGLIRISRHIPVIIPLHPRTRKVIKSYQIKTEGLHIIEPVGYFEMLYLLQHCGVVVTDSGGVQKEAYFSNKPCLTMLDYTPWLELVQCGVNTVVDSDSDLIYETAMRKLEEVAQQEFPVGLYGDGHAGEKIVKILARSQAIL